MNKTQSVRIIYDPKGAEYDDSDRRYHYMATYENLPFIENVFCWGETRTEALSKLMLWEESQNELV
jgi:hypothetical protein